MTDYIQTQSQSVLTSQAAQCQTALISPHDQTSHPAFLWHTLIFSTSRAAQSHKGTFPYERQDLFQWNCTTLLILSFSASLSSMQLLSTSHYPYLAGVIAAICQHTIPSVFHLCSWDRERKGQGEWEWAENMSLCNTCTYGGEFAIMCVTQWTGVQNNALVVNILSRRVVCLISSDNEL